MAIDEAAAARMRAAIGPEPGLSEMKMMGGLCFLMQGNMVAGADRPKGGAARFLFRVGPGNAAQAAALGGGAEMEMGGRRMAGFWFVPSEGCSDERLAGWVALAMSFVRTLPPKVKA